MAKAKCEASIFHHRTGQSGVRRVILHTATGCRDIRARRYFSRRDGELRTSPHIS
jgi:hypothetical protein